MRYKLSAPATLHTTIQLPASKSISNRALILHALAQGHIAPSNLSDCDDTRVMIKALDGNPGHIDILAAGTATVSYTHLEHKVDFYAAHLNLSAHHLTQIVKLVTGQSVSDFIFEMLFSEARNLLTHSKLSIQEIATTLNFSDQSSFGKFFKRKAGVSPVDFRKDIVFVEER